MTYSVSEVARSINYSPSSIRNFTRQFADFLSQDANPADGNERRYNEHDLAILATVAQHKREKKANDAIRAILDSDDLVDLPPEAAEMPQDGRNKQTAIVTRMTATVARFEGDLAATKEALDYTRNELKDANQKIEGLTERAVAAETELKVLRDIVDRDKPTEKPEEEDRRSFWQRLLRR